MHRFGGERGVDISLGLSLLKMTKIRHVVAEKVVNDEGILLSY